MCVRTQHVLCWQLTSTGLFDYRTHLLLHSHVYFETEVDLAANNIIWRTDRFASAVTSKLSPLRDTLMCNEGIARSDHVSPRSILPEINGRQAPCLPTRAADGPRSVLGYTGVSIIGLLIERWFLCGCTMPEREIVVFFKELHREQGINIFDLSW